MNEQYGERKTNLYGYHEFVAHSLSAVVNGFNGGQTQASRRILAFLYQYGKINAGEKVSEEELKALEKKSTDEISIESLSALKRAGLAPVQDEFSSSFYKTIIRKKRGN
jgi:hypothetical protein